MNTKLKIITLLILLLAGCKQLIQEEKIMAIEIRSQLGNVLLSGNPIFVDVYATFPAGSSENKILLRIVSVDGALFGAPFIDAIAPDLDDMATFNISGRVTQPVEYNFQFPQVDKYIAHALLAFDITIEPGIEYINSSNELQTDWSGITESHRILKGGLSHYKQQEIPAYLFYDLFIKPGSGITRFLTWQPNNAKIHLTQPLKLWYIYPHSTSKTLYMHYYIFYKNNDIVEKVEAITVDPDKLYELNLSPELWQVEAQHNNSDVDYIRFELIDSKDFGYSESRIFYFNHNYYEENTFIYFKNSIAGIDCLWCSGKVQQLFNSEKQIAVKPDPSGMFDNKQPTRVVSSVAGQRSWNINTGYKSKAEIAALRDFALSGQMWLIDENHAIPVYLEDEKHVMEEITRNLDDISFVLLEGHKESYF